MCYRGSEVMKEVAWVIFDEIHYLVRHIDNVDVSMASTGFFVVAYATIALTNRSHLASCAVHCRMTKSAV